MYNCHHFLHKGAPYHSGDPREQVLRTLASQQERFVASPIHPSPCGSTVYACTTLERASAGLSTLCSFYSRYVFDCSCTLLYAKPALSKTTRLPGKHTCTWERQPYREPVFSQHVLSSGLETNICMLSIVLLALKSTTGSVSPLLLLWCVEVF